MNRDSKIVIAVFIFFAVWIVLVSTAISYVPTAIEIVSEAWHRGAAQVEKEVKP